MRSVLAFALACAAAAAQAVTIEPRSFALGHQPVAADVYLPAALPARGLVVIAHGFTRSRARHQGLAQRLAGAGFVVAVPDLPNWFCREADADAIVELVAALSAERGLEAQPVVLIGTSAGGLATLLAADRVPRLALWVGLDPVDTFGVGAENARKLSAPALVLRAPGGACNSGGSARRIAERLPNRRVERIDGASHCDFEDTTNWRCESLCGPADPARQALIVDEVAKALDAALPR